VSTEAEHVIAAIWERVLGRAGIGPGDDFFALGGNQFQGTTVLELLEDAFAVKLSPAELRRASTVTALAAAVEAGRRAGPEIPPSVAPVAFSQEGMLWQEQFAPGCQNLPPLARRYRGPLHVDVLERALAEIVNRHEPLRTRFELRDGRLVQVVAPPERWHLPGRDLKGLAPDAQEVELDRALAAAARPFDLARGTMFEPTLFALGSEDNVLVIRAHHSVYDDWSVSVFRRELSTLYAAFLSGAASPLADLPLSFTGYARGQRRRLAGPAGTAQLSYWRRRLSGAPLSLDLPIGDPDRPPGAPQASAQPLALDLPSELVAKLRALARRERATIFMTVLTAFQVLLHGRTGQSELLMASVVANRDRTELEGMIGCFTKKVLLRLSSVGDPTFGGLLARAREVVLGALAHQDLPFETVLQEVLGPAAACHGLVPTVAVMFQGVTPQTEEVVLPGVTSTGFATSTTTTRAHFAGASEDDRPEPATTPWGGGLYSGTFLILSVIEDEDRLSLVARGAFHRPAVERLLATFGALLADIASHPDCRVSELAPREGGEAGGECLELRGFRIDRLRLEAGLRSAPAVRDVAVALREDSPGGEPRLVAYVVPQGHEPPTLAGLRAHLWSTLPGYAWPAALVVVADLPVGPDVSGAALEGVAVEDGGAEVGRTEEEQRLGALWAEVLGIEAVDGGANYWQSFSFIEVLDRARAAEIRIGEEQMARNRTVVALATDVAAEALASCPTSLEREW
jgi:hypothetical protein